MAAGSGQRLGGAVPKQYQALGDRAVLRHAIDNLLADPRVAGVQVVIDPAHRALYGAAVAGLDLPPPALGGASRQESVRAGLAALAAAAPDVVLIHDAARPFLTGDVLDRLFTGLTQYDGAVAALPVVDSLKRGADGQIAADVDRAGLWRAQTPQAFDFTAIHEAHRTTADDPALTDDAAVARGAGLTVALVDGDEALFKITTPADLVRARHWLGLAAARQIRVGQGFDVHRFGAGDHVILGGVKIPHDHGLIGHSDADVALHALTDAVLGALADGDIGQHFPPSDPRWKDADSRVFLRHAGARVAAAGGRITHIDLTIIAERPRIGPHRPAMVRHIADTLALADNQVSVKATTTERLGAMGRGEGLAALALCTVEI
ncbi:MAG: bifunctional 2-C-methyl-D-erythritol 4-phosphate cytidylyltransferase/2-C-methyl-D-erythritol 2,4-cyclodiphosphate synthase [Thalassobaculaceae bacterium]